MSRTQLSSVVSRQIPEFIREDYPTFVAFVEAYYEYLQEQGVDLSTARDLDKTLDEFIVEFKKELAHNLPQIDADERFICVKSYRLEGADYEAWSSDDSYIIKYVRDQLQQESNN